jgi:hypothetical protein
MYVNAAMVRLAEESIFRIFFPAEKLLSVEAPNELSLILRGKQGCPMVCFQTQNTIFGKIWRALEWKMLLYML